MRKNSNWEESDQKKAQLFLSLCRLHQVQTAAVHAAAVISPSQERQPSCVHHKWLWRFTPNPKKILYPHSPHYMLKCCVWADPQGKTDLRSLTERPLIAMASNRLALAFNLIVMASNLIAIASHSLLFLFRALDLLVPFFRPISLQSDTDVLT